MSNELTFPTNTMTQLEAELYRQERPEYDYASLVPVRTDIDPNVASVMTLAVSENGEAQPVTGKPGEALPKVDFSASSATVNIITMGMSYDITLDDIMISNSQGNIDPMRIKIESTFNGFGAGTQRMALNGNAKLGIQGLTNLSGIAESGVNAVAVADKFNADTATQKAVVRHITNAMAQVRKQTQYARNPDTIVMSGEAYDAIVALRNEQTGQTALEAIQETSTTMLGRPINIVASPYFGNDMLVYSYDPSVLSMWMPMPLTFLAPQPKSLGWDVPSFYRISPVQVKNSKAFYRLKNVIA